uniref:Uncharacterized protein n=1 Tax=Solanum tuberosum TaxID=4113 RepID=M1BII1_SOLTU
MAENGHQGKRKLEEESSVNADIKGVEYDSDHDMYVGKSIMDRETREKYWKQVEESENTKFKFVENLTVTTALAAGYWCRNTFLVKDSDSDSDSDASFTFQALGF